MHGVFKPKRNSKVSSSEHIREARKQARRIKDTRVNRFESKTLVMV